MQINVTKANGTLEPIDLSKMSKALQWAIGKLTGVSQSDIEIQSKLHFFDGIHTSYITDVLIKTCDDMADLRNPNYDTVARNLKLQKLYKRVFGSITPPSLGEFIKARIDEGHYRPELLSSCTEQLEAAIDHSRDFTFSSAGLDALINGYGVCDMETPQFMYMAIAIDIFRDYHINPTQYIIDMYEALSTFKITLPTPEMKSLRTDSTDYASCILMRMGDSLDSWKAASNALVSHTAASAGCGIDIADNSSIGDRVKLGKIKHSGKLPICKSVDTDILKTSQNGRRGSATAFINFFDPEIESIFALKSPRMPVEDRINDLSYGIKMNQLAYDRAKSGGVISLFSTRVAPDLLDLFYSDDIAAFTARYEELEAQELYTAQIDAQDYWTRLVAVESAETSSYYIINIDEVNANSPYTKPITQSNICVEVMQPTEPLSLEEPDSPDIGVCVLTNLNQGIIPIEDLPHYTNLAVRAQSHIMQRQVHPTPQANAFVKHYRDIGIGLSNHAYWLAKQGFRYGQPAALEAHNEWMEHFAFGLYSASLALAKELGPAPGLKYHSKLLPVMRYNLHVDELVSEETYCDWTKLSCEIQQYGLYNCGLSAVPPSESSSVPSNQTSSLEPIRSLLTIKDKSGTNYKQFAPEAIALADKYDYAYDSDITPRFFKNVVVTQKWIDKGISANAFYNPELHNGKVPAKLIVSDLFLAKYYGLKSRYYQNTKLPDEQELQIGGCTNGSCEV